VTKQQLDLLKLAAGGAAQLCACATKVVRRKSRDADPGGVLALHLPDDLFAEPITRNAVATYYRTEDVTIRNPSGRAPCINRDFHPGRHWSGSDPAVFSDEIHDAPTSIALLDMCERQRRHFRSSEPAAEENCENGAITQAAERRDVRRAQKRLRLPLRQPVANANAGSGSVFKLTHYPNADRLDTLHAADPLG